MVLDFNLKDRSNLLAIADIVQAIVRSMGSI